MLRTRQSRIIIRTRLRRLLPAFEMSGSRQTQIVPHSVALVYTFWRKRPHFCGDATHTHVHTLIPMCPGGWPKYFEIVYAHDYALTTERVLLAVGDAHTQVAAAIVGSHTHTFVNSFKRSAEMNFNK